MKINFKIMDASAAWLMIVLVLLINITNISRYDEIAPVLGGTSSQSVPELLPSNGIVFQSNWYEKPSPKTIGYFHVACHPILKQSIDWRMGEKIRAIRVLQFNLFNVLNYNTPKICYKFPLSEHTEAG